MNLTKEEILNDFEMILGKKDLKFDDNFFESGGDSFDAIRLLYKLNVDIKIIDIFNNPTVNQLHQFILNNIDLKYDILVKLNNVTSGKGECVFIGIPYGGGGVSVYKKISSEIYNMPVYGVDTDLLDTDSIEKFKASVELLANKIIELNFKKVVLYGHCAGSSLALYLEKILKSKVKVKLILAASVPILSPEDSLIDFMRTSDDKWGNYLRKIGGFKGLNNQEIKNMLVKGRHDHLISVMSYMNIFDIDKKSKATLILGENDPVTSTDFDLISKWQRFVEINRVEKISGAGHYFINEYKNELLKIFNNVSEER